MRKIGNFRPAVSFEDAFCKSSDADFAYGLALGTVGLALSLIYILHELHDNMSGDWATPIKYEVGCLFLSLMFLFLLRRSKRRAETLAASLSVALLTTTIVVLAYIAQWKVPKSVVHCYLLYTASVLCFVSTYFFVRYLVRYYTATDDVDNDIEYVTSRVRRCDKKTIPKAALSVSLHPSYEVISSPSEPHLRIQPVINPSSPVTVGHMFIAHDMSAAAPPGEDMLSRFKKKKRFFDAPRKTTQDKRAIAHPPVFVLIGSLLSLAWLGYLAVVVYDKMHLQALSDLSQEMNDDSNGLASDWKSLQSSVATLGSALQSAYESGTLSDSDKAALEQAMEQLIDDAQSMESSTRSASSHLDNYSYWAESFRVSLLLGIRLGAGVAITVGAIFVGLSVQKSYLLQLAMQAGVWRENEKISDKVASLVGIRGETSCHHSDIPSQHDILPLGSTLVGTQLGLTLASFTVITAVVSAVSLVLIMQPTRLFLWNFRYHALVMLVLLGLGAGGVHILHRQSTKADETRVSERSLSASATLLTFFNIIPYHLIGVCQYIYAMVKGLSRWGRIDISSGGYLAGCSVVGSAHTAFIGLLLLEHQTNNPIVRGAAAVLISRWRRKAANRRAEMRWFLAYTLIKNPSLVQYRIRFRPSSEGTERAHSLSGSISGSEDASSMAPDGVRPQDVQIMAISTKEDNGNGSEQMAMSSTHKQNSFPETKRPSRNPSNSYRFSTPPPGSSGRPSMTPSNKPSASSRSSTTSRSSSRLISVSSSPSLPPLPPSLTGASSRKLTPFRDNDSSLSSTAKSSHTVIGGSRALGSGSGGDPVVYSQIDDSYSVNLDRTPPRISAQETLRRAALSRPVSGTTL